MRFSYSEFIIYIGSQLTEHLSENFCIYCAKIKNLTIKHTSGLVIIICYFLSSLGLEGHLDYLKDMPVSFDQSGAVYMINLTTVLQHGNDISIGEINYAAIFEGDRSFARFGWSLALTDVNHDGVKDLLFSAPFRTEDITEVLRGGLY